MSASGRRTSRLWAALTPWWWELSSTEARALRGSASFVTDASGTCKGGPSAVCLAAAEMPEDLRPPPVEQPAVSWASLKELQGMLGEVLGELEAA